MDDCVNYGKLYSQNILIHTYEKVSEVASTCVTYGTATYQCTSCGEKKVEPLDLSDHTYDEGEVIEPATSTANGLMKYSCIIDGCNHSIEEEIPMLHEHTYGEWVTDNHYHWHVATCEEHIGEIIDKKLHTWVLGEVSGTSRTDTCACGASREVDIWDGTTASTSLSGTGTLEDPVLIQSAADLAFFASQVTNKTDVYSGKFIKMTTSVDLDNNSLMIGTFVKSSTTNGFAGTFDGNNNWVLNMEINEANGTGVGLFRQTTSKATIKNLFVTGSVVGYERVGGIVAESLGNIENCVNYANVLSNYFE